MVSKEQRGEEETLEYGEEIEQLRSGSKLRALSYSTSFTPIVFIGILFILPKLYLLLFKSLFDSKHKNLCFSCERNCKDLGNYRLKHQAKLLQAFKIVYQSTTLRIQLTNSQPSLSNVNTLRYFPAISFGRWKGIVDPSITESLLLRKKVVNFPKQAQTRIVQQQNCLIVNGRKIECFS